MPTGARVHPLMRSVIAGQARASERRAAHRRLATAVHGPEPRARHLALGIEGPDEAVAPDLSCRRRPPCCPRRQAAVLYKN